MQVQPFELGDRSVDHGILDAFIHHYAERGHHLFRLRIDDQNPWVQNACLQYRGYHEDDLQHWQEQGGYMFVSLLSPFHVTPVTVEGYSHITIDSILVGLLGSEPYPYYDFLEAIVTSSYFTEINPVIENPSMPSEQIPDPADAPRYRHRNSTSEGDVWDCFGRLISDYSGLTGRDPETVRRDLDCVDADVHTLRFAPASCPPVPTLPPPASATDDPNKCVGPI